MASSIFTFDDIQDQSGSSGKVSVTFDGKFAIITYYREQNRLNLDFITRVHEALDEVERCVINLLSCMQI